PADMHTPGELAGRSGRRVLPVARDEAAIDEHDTAIGFTQRGQYMKSGPAPWPGRANEDFLIVQEDAVIDHRPEFHRARIGEGSRRLRRGRRPGRFTLGDQTALPLQPLQLPLAETE